MAGEINGTAVVVNNTTGEVVGQGDFSRTFGGTPIVISNKSYGDHVTYLDGELSDKQEVWAGEMTYNNDEQFRKVRTDARTGTMDTYTLTFVGSGATTDESIVATCIPTGLSDALPRGGPVVTSIAFNSSGEPTYTPASDA